MAEAQYVSTDPQAASLIHPTMHAPTGNEPVTLGDLKEDPIGSIKRIGHLLATDVTDPRLWVSLAASYFGPKVFNVAAPLISRAAAGVGRGAAAIEPGDIVGMIPRPRSIDAAIKVAQKVGTAMRTPPATEAPPVTPPAGVPPAAAPATAAPAAMPTDVGKIVKALAAQGMTPSEIDQAVKWLRAGAARDLAARLGTPTSAQVRTAVTDRNAAGRWPE